MPDIPIMVKETEFSLYLIGEGLKRIYQGKTRDMYDLVEKLLVVASDRLSIFDFVLATIVPYKGEVLTALTHFWMTKILEQFPNHLVDSAKYPGQNAVHDYLHKLPELPMRRSLVVQKIDILPYELIFRHHIGGSVFKKYTETGMAGGQKLPPNLPKWSKLESPIFTPSTKEEVGHDININSSDFFEQCGDRGRELVNMYKKGYEQAYSYAEERGVLILDTKFEGNFFLFADEILTPDSSRFCDKEDWEQAMKDQREPNFMDKQVVRAWGETVKTPFESEGREIVGLKGLNPTDEKHIRWVHQLEVPGDIITETTKRYLEIFKRLTGMTLDQYQTEEMKIAA